MDKKKLIGTIIGVTLFGALIVGATYAWMTFNATVSNTVFNSVSLTYWVDYEKGSEITGNLPILIDPTPEKASKTVLTAKRPKGSVADNIFIYLTSTSINSLTKSGSVKYAICQGTCTSFAVGDPNTVTTGVGKIETVTMSASATAAVTQTVGVTSSADPEYIYRLPGTLDSDSNETVTFTVYMWLDPQGLTSDMVGDDPDISGNENGYIGYLHAEAKQANSTTYK